MITLLLASLLTGVAGLVLTANLLLSYWLARVLRLKNKVAMCAFISFQFFSLLLAESFVALTYVQHYVELVAAPSITQCFIQ
jgi:hypothetical protein